MAERYLLRTGGGNNAVNKSDRCVRINKFFFLSCRLPFLLFVPFVLFASSSIRDVDFVATTEVAKRRQNTIRSHTRTQARTHIHTHAHKRAREHTLIHSWGTWCARLRCNINKNKWKRTAARKTSRIGRVIQSRTYQIVFRLKCWIKLLARLYSEVCFSLFFFFEMEQLKKMKEGKIETLRTK